MTNNKLYGVIITIVFHSIILFLALYLSLNLPDPPPKESAILVAFGSDDFTEVTPQKQTVAVQPTGEPEPYEEEETLTQEIEEAPAIQTPPKPKKPKAQPQKPKQPIPQPTANPNPTPTPVTTPTPQVNQRALYSGGQSTVPSTNTTGSAGDPLGSPEGVSPTGSPYGNKEGASLEGRNLVGNLPKPKYDTQESGKVVVKIWVNTKGDVIKSEAQLKGTTVQNAQLLKMSEEAAMRAKFNNIETNTNIQIGYITYIFKLN